MGPKPLDSVPYGCASMVGLLWGLMAYGERPATVDAELTSDDWKALETPRPLEPPELFAVGVPPVLPADPGESD